MTSIDLHIPAAAPWVDTGLDVARGDVLEIRAVGTWRDAWICCGPEGHDSAYLRPFSGLRRLPAARWMELTACVGQRLDGAAAVGASGAFTAPEAGRLYLFANDAPGMYWNNRGFIHVGLRRVGSVSAHGSERARQRSTPSGSPVSIHRASSVAAPLSALLLFAQGAPAVSQSTPEPVTAERPQDGADRADPFEQFDLGVAVVVGDGGVSAWTSADEAGVRLLARTVTVEPGDTVDRLLRAGGVRPDDYSRSLIGTLNLRLDEALRLTPGEPLTVISVEGLPPDALLALQPYQGQRRELERLSDEIQAAIESLRPDLSYGEFAQVSIATDQLLTADLRARRTQPDQLAFATETLDQHRRLLSVAGGADVSARDISASARLAAAGLGASGRGGRRSSRWLVRVTAPGGMAEGYCRLAWSVGGFKDHPGSVEREALPLSGPVPVPPADLVAWVERGGRVISDELEVRRAQLQAVNVRQDALVARERCDQ